MKIQLRQAYIDQIEKCVYSTHHSVGDITKKDEKHKGEGVVPWLVFRKR